MGLGCTCAVELTGSLLLTGGRGEDVGSIRAAAGGGAATRVLSTAGSGAIGAGRWLASGFVVAEEAVTGAEGDSVTACSSGSSVNS
ncbi:MAG: hypothetical protein K9J43_05980, partial [Polynucleobacter sp.]|nr:hypothetical protein [Polynucleobacter sp.]